MQGYFTNRDKTGTAGLSGREVLIVGWLVCLGKREFPVDPHRDPRAEKSGPQYSGDLGKHYILTHAVTHEQKNWGGNNGEKRIYG